MSSTGYRFDEGHRIRVWNLFIPTLRTRIRYLAVLAIGFVLALIIGFVIPMAFFALVFRSRPSLPSWAIAVSAIGMVAAPLTWIHVYQRYRHSQLMKPTGVRARRLGRVIQHPAFWQRVPHRRIECVLRRFQFQWRHLRREIKNVPSGHLIIIASHIHYRWPAPPILEIPFEPLDLHEESEDGYYLFYRLWGNVDSDCTEAEPEGSELSISSGEKIKIVLRWAIGWAWIIVWIGLVLRDGWNRTIGFGLIGLLFLCVPFVIYLFWNRRWWIVPGGLVYRSSRMWRQGDQIRLITPHDSPLIIDLRTGKGMVVEHGRPLTFTCGEMGRWLLIPAWISRARRPNMDELQSLLGVRAG